MPADRPSVKRCAVYARKSSEEGLDQDFNSLQAQREACVAYIASQRGEGWQLVITAYNDGGISGGTMERPSLRRLMADIEAGLVDVIVVYKVDRLTRSLHDFSKMVEVFDRQGVSFVAVTQQFNTTTSMGRLTLNVLLSFAQFEREVTGERIRDKIAASKKKGMWMGGTVPLGYRVEDRKIHVVPDEAAIVREIFRRYLNCRSVRELSNGLREDGIVSRRNFAFRDGVLYCMLSNPIYIGQIVHKRLRHPGLHDSIMDLETWEAVRKKLLAGTVAPDASKRKTDFSPLKGKLFDEAGHPFSPDHCIKRGRRYRYYASRPEYQPDTKISTSSWRLPAKDFERCITRLVMTMMADRGLIASTALAKEMNPADLDAVLTQARQFKEENSLASVERVDLKAEQITVSMILPGVIPLELTRTIPMVLKKRGVERRIVIQGVPLSDSSPDPLILNAISRGTQYWEQLLNGKYRSFKEIATAVKLDDRYVGRTVQLAFLAPDIVEMFVRGQQSPEWSTERLLRHESLPVSWADQRKLLARN